MVRTFECHKISEDAREVHRKARKNENINCRGKFCLALRGNVAEIFVSELVKNVDSKIKTEQHIKEKYGDKWRCIDVKASYC